MTVFGYFLAALARVLDIVLMLYIWVLLFRVVLSWVQVPSLYQVKVILYRLTEPVLGPIRRFVPPYRFGGLDISPIIAFLAIMFLRSFLVRTLAFYARQLLTPTTGFF
jgi:YggT family protein